MKATTGNDSYQTFQWPVRIYYEDTDAGGVVYHANYLKFMERARTEHLRTLGYELDTLPEQEGILFVVRSANLEYLKPARLNDLLSVITQITRIRAASLHFDQHINRGQQLLCKGHIQVVTIDANTFKPKTLPPHMLKQLTIPN